MRLDRAGRSSMASAAGESNVGRTGPGATRYGHAGSERPMQRALEKDRGQASRPVHRIDLVRLRRLAARPEAGPPLVGVNSIQPCHRPSRRRLPQAFACRGRRRHDRFGELQEHFSQARPSTLFDSLEPASRAGCRTASTLATRSEGCKKNTSSVQLSELDLSPATCAMMSHAAARSPRVEIGRVRLRRRRPRPRAGVLRRRPGLRHHGPGRGASSAHARRRGLLITTSR